MQRKARAAAHVAHLRKDRNAALRPRVPRPNG